MKKRRPLKWKTVRSRYLVRDRWLRLRADTCVTPTGETIEPFYVFEYEDWVNCLAVDGAKNALLVQHYRHGIGESLREIVAGTIEEGDPSPADAARRELREELGYVGGEIHPLGVTYPNPASQNNKVHSFLAIGGRCTATPTLEPGETFRAEPIPLAHLASEIRDPTTRGIYQAMHLTTIFLALEHLNRSDERVRRATNT